MKQLICILTALVCILHIGAQGLAEPLCLPDFNSGKMIWIVRAGVSFNGVIGSARGTQKDIWEEGDWRGSYKPVYGPDLSFGFNKAICSSNLFWGSEIGIGTRGYKASATHYYSKVNKLPGNVTIYDSSSSTSDGILCTYNIKLTPGIIGYRYFIKDRMALDAHVGVFVSYDVFGHLKNHTTSRITSSYKGGGRDDYDEQTYKTKISKLKNMNKYDIGADIGVGFWFGKFNIDVSWQQGCIPIFDDGDEEISKDKKKGNYYSSNLEVKLGYAF